MERRRADAGKQPRQFRAEHRLAPVGADRRFVEAAHRGFRAVRFERFEHRALAIPIRAHTIRRGAAKREAVSAIDA